MKDSTLAIYPTARKATDQLMQASRGDCVLGARVTTLPQVVEALWRESVDPRTPLSEVGERLVLLEVLAEVAPTVTAISGMADRLLALVRQLKSAALTAADWDTVYAALPPGERSRLALFTRVFDAYTGLLADRGLVDRHDREAAALGLLHRMEREGRKPAYLAGVERLLVAEIYDLSLVQFMTVAALIRLIGDAQLTIQAEPHKVDASRFADLTWNRFAGEESIADQVLPEFVRRAGRPGRLGFVIEHLFTETYPSPPEADATITIMEAPNPRDEAEAVARAIRRRLEHADLPLDRIAIVARDLTLYRDYLDAAFRRYRIPLTLETGQPVRAASPASALLQLIAIPLDDYPRDALLTFCVNPYTRHAAARYLSLLDDIGYLDRKTRSLAECVDRRRRELDNSDDSVEDLREPSVTVRDRLRHGATAWTELLDALATLEPPATLSAHLERLTKLLERCAFDPTAGDLTGAGAPAAAALLRTLDELAIEAARVVPRRTITLREFAATLEAVLRATPVTSEAAEGGAVRALPLRDARGLDFDLLFILGLNDGVFPHYYPEDPLVPDATALALNRALRIQLARRFGDRAPDAPGAILRTRGQRNSEEPFLFFLALSMAEREVVLSCCNEDESGRPLARSPFLEEVARLLGPSGDFAAPTGHEPLTSSNPIGREGWENCFAERDFLNRAAARGELTTALAVGHIDAGRIQSIAERIAIERQRAQYFALPSREELFELQRHASDDDGWGFAKVPSPQDSVKGARAGAYDGRVTSGPGLVRFIRGTEQPYRWSAAQLTELASCGFKFFARRVLLLRDQDEVEHALSRLETGVLVHDILRDYFDAKPDFTNQVAAFALLARIADPIRRRERSAARDAAFFDLEWAAVAAMLDEIVRYEIARREEDGSPSETRNEYLLDFTLDAPGTDHDAQLPNEPPIALRGWIDRLEIHRNTANRIERLSVIDYKTSAGLKTLTRILRPDSFGVSDLQIPVYLLGAVASLRSQLAPDALARASYMALKHRDKETPPLDVPLELLDPAPSRTAAGPNPIGVAARIRQIVGDALDGRFDVDPLECSDWCPYRPVCRFAKENS